LAWRNSQNSCPLAKEKKREKGRRKGVGIRTRRQFFCQKEKRHLNHLAVPFKGEGKKKKKKGEGGDKVVARLPRSIFRKKKKEEETPFFVGLLAKKKKDKGKTYKLTVKRSPKNSRLPGRGGGGGGKREKRGRRERTGGLFRFSFVFTGGGDQGRKSRMVVKPPTTNTPTDPGHTRANFQFAVLFVLPQKEKKGKGKKGKGGGGGKRGKAQGGGARKRVHFPSENRIAPYH